MPGKPIRQEGWDSLLAAVAEQARADVRTSLTHEHTRWGEIRATRHSHPDGNQRHDHGHPGRYRGAAAPERCNIGEDHPWPLISPHQLIRSGDGQSRCLGCSWKAAPLMDPAWNGETHNVLECAVEFLEYLEHQVRSGRDPLEAVLQTVIS